MTTLEQVRGFLESGEFYNARVAIEALDEGDEIEGKLLKIELFERQGRTRPALDTVRFLLREGGPVLTSSQRQRARAALGRLSSRSDERLDRP